MREIKFRGKRVDNGEWLYGNLLDLVINEMEALPAIRTFCQVPCPYDYMQPVLGSEDFVVDENTVGQYTGLKDKNGTEIFEGDIVEFNGGSENGICKIIFKNCCFVAEWIIKKNFMDFETSMMYLQCAEELEVIGNIYDNPELLEVQQNDR